MAIVALWRTRGHGALTGVIVDQVQRRYRRATGARHRIVELFVLDSHTDYNSYSPSGHYCTTSSVIARRSPGITSSQTAQCKSYRTRRKLVPIYWPETRLACQFVSERY